MSNVNARICSSNAPSATTMSMRIGDDCTVRTHASGFVVQEGMTKTAEDLRYPIGRFRAVMPVTSELRAAAIDAIAGLPERLRGAVAGLSDAQLETPYRPDGWTVRQVVHHVADSHMNGFIRLKLALTEDSPTIKPYDEKRWADLHDMGLAIDASLAILDQVHARWDAVHRAMPPA